MRRRAVCTTVATLATAGLSGCLERLLGDESTVHRPGERSGEWSLETFDDSDSVDDILADHEAASDELAHASIVLERETSSENGPFDAFTPIRRTHDHLPELFGSVITTQSGIDTLADLDGEIVAGSAAGMYDEATDFLRATDLDWAYLVGLEMAVSQPTPPFVVDHAGTLPGSVAYLSAAGSLAEDGQPTTYTSLIRVGAWSPPAGLILGLTLTLEEATAYALYDDPSMGERAI